MAKKGPKKEQKKEVKVDEKQQLESQFEQYFNGLVTKIKELGEQSLGIKEEKYRLQFIDFLKRFKQLYKKEFFADIHTSVLLRDIFVSECNRFNFLLSSIQKTSPWKRNRKSL